MWQGGMAAQGQVFSTSSRWRAGDNGCGRAVPPHGSVLAPPSLSPAPSSHALLQSMGSTKSLGAGGDPRAWQNLLCLLCIPPQHAAGGLARANGIWSKFGYLARLVFSPHSPAAEVRETCGDICGVLALPKVAVETGHPRFCLPVTLADIFCKFK